MSWFLMRLIEEATDSHLVQFPNSPASHPGVFGYPFLDKVCKVHPTAKILGPEEPYSMDMFQRVAICTCWGPHAWRSIVVRHAILEWDEQGPLPFCKMVAPVAEHSESPTGIERPIKLQRISKFRSACVLGGEDLGTLESYGVAALQLAKALLERNIGLIYGGGTLGQVGKIAQIYERAGKSVLGVVPRPLLPLPDKTYGPLKIVKSMHEKKAVMFNLSDLFIALPGDFVALDVLIEMTTCARMRIHKKPIGVLNVSGYYDNLLGFFDHAVERGFMIPAHRSIIVSAANAEELLQRFEDYVPIEEPGIVRHRWEDTGEGPSGSAPQPLPKSFLGLAPSSV